MIRRPCWIVLPPWRLGRYSNHEEASETNYILVVACHSDIHAFVHDHVWGVMCLSRYKQGYRLMHKSMTKGIDI